MRIFQIILDDRNESSLTIELPKPSYFESGQNSVKFHYEDEDGEDSVVEYYAKYSFVKSVIGDVEHTPMMAALLDNGDSVKIGWTDDKQMGFKVRTGYTTESIGLPKGFRVWNATGDFSIGQDIQVMQAEWELFNNRGVLHFKKSKVTFVRELHTTEPTTAVALNQ